MVAVLAEDIKVSEYFKVTSSTQPSNCKMKELLANIWKDRELHQQLKEQVQKGSLHICEKHFRPEEMELCKYL